MKKGRVHEIEDQVGFKTWKVIDNTAIQAPYQIHQTLDQNKLTFLFFILRKYEHYYIKGNHLQHIKRYVANRMH